MAAATILQTIRMMLEEVPMQMLKDLAESTSNARVRYQTLGPMFDPTDFQRHGADKERNFETVIAAARALLDLKKAWRQDIPLNERIQEELNAGAPKDDQD